MLNNLNFSYSTYAIVLAAEYLARITSVHFWGRFADRVGNIRVLSIVTRLIPFVPILWLFSPNVVYLVFVQILSGVCWAAFDLSNQGYIYQVAPQSKLLYVVYNRSVGLMCMALGGLLGVYLLRGIPPLGGSQIFSIFLLSGIFRLVVVVLLAHRLIDFALPVSQSKINRKVDIDSAFNRMALKQGLYYHPEEWKEFASVTLSPETKDSNKKAKVTPSKQGLYYHPEEWGKFVRMVSSPETKAATVNAKVAPYKQGLYYRPEVWATFKLLPVISFT
jgi:MFS family permease